MIADDIQLLESTFFRFLECDDKRAPSQQGAAPASPLLRATPSAVYLMSQYGGRSFGGGVYRVHTVTEAARWTEVIAQAYPTHLGFECFASDWQGNLFALHPTRKVNGEPGVSLFEPGTGKVLSIPANFITLHTAEMIEDPEAVLARSVYEGWLNAGGDRPSTSECIGLAIPMFLGGSDMIDNMEKSDMDVYWELTSQMLAQVKDFK